MDVLLTSWYIKYLKAVPLNIAIVSPISQHGFAPPFPI